MRLLNLGAAALVIAVAISPNVQAKDTKDKPATAKAAPCRDAAGHYMTCPKAAAAKAEKATAKADVKTAKAEAKANPTEKTTATKDTKVATAEAPITKAPAGTDAAITAKCKDGTTSKSQHHSGTCSSHGGVAEFYK